MWVPALALPLINREGLDKPLPLSGWMDRLDSLWKQNCGRAEVASVILCAQLNASLASSCPLVLLKACDWGRVRTNVLGGRNHCKKSDLSWPREPPPATPPLHAALEERSWWTPWAVMFATPISHCQMSVDWKIEENFCWGNLTC